MLPTSIYWKDLETMINPVAMGALSVHTVASLYHDLVEETGLFRQIANSGSGTGNP